MEREMEENKFWYGIWKLLATCFCVLVGTVGGCSINSNLAIERAIAMGADPLLAACALGSCEKSTAISLSHTRK